MKNNLFTNDSLVSILVSFVGKVEARIAALLAHDVVATTSLIRNEHSPELSDELLDGICADMVQEIQQTRDLAVVAQRGLSSETISEFIYLLAALVDEMLISTLKNQLPRRFNGAVEYMIFGTRDAGEEVFMRIERLLARRSQLDFGLAGAYLLTLSLGFKGQYFQQGKSEMLMRYHHDLSSLALRVETVPELHRISVEGGDKSAIPGMAMQSLLPFLWCAIGVTWLAAVIGMEIFWRSDTSPVRRTAAEHRAPASPTPLPGNDQ